MSSSPHLVFPSVGTRGAESRLWSLQGRHHERARRTRRGDRRVDDLQAPRLRAGTSNPPLARLLRDRLARKNFGFCPRSTLSTRMSLFPNVRNADRPALTSPIRPPPQLAARIAVSNLHKNTKKSFSETYVPRPSAPRAFPASVPRVSEPAGFQTSDARVSVSRGFENERPNDPRRRARRRSPRASLATPD